MKELVVISGKGGTGKTSLLASFAVLAGNAVIADCDVDAADLHLILTPTEKECHEFRSGYEAVIDKNCCNGCGLCVELCRFGALIETDALGRSVVSIDPHACEGCGVCERVCPNGAIHLKEKIAGSWMVSDTRIGPMVHARLAIAADNSGKLVTAVRQAAKRIAEETHRDLILVDGPPGIGCPAIAAFSGASQCLVVTEPTVSGRHDLERVLALAKHFRVPASVCVNKWDINPALTMEIERAARALGAQVVGRIRYDPEVTKAQIRALAPVETDAPCAADITGIWNTLHFYLKRRNS
jgi:MinD superfamily P-loop ATPase